MYFPYGKTSNFVDSFAIVVAVGVFPDVLFSVAVVESFICVVGAVAIFHGYGLLLLLCYC